MTFLAQHHLWSPEALLVSKTTALYRSGYAFPLTVLSLTSQGPLASQRLSRRTHAKFKGPTGNRLDFTT